MFRLFSVCFAFSLAALTHTNDIPPRLQWMHNDGYCGEVSLISAGLYYGQYVSQFDARALATGRQVDGELLVGVNDQIVAKKMHLEYEEWDTVAETDTDQFLVWVKQKVLQGNPVAIGLYANQYLFYNVSKPNAGHRDYDHIVSVVSIESDHLVYRNNSKYYGDDQFGFNDQGLWDNGEGNPDYYFSYGFDDCQMDRREANAKEGPIYSLAGNASNYGIAITGIKDLNEDTVPVRLTTNVNYEKPEIGCHSNLRPDPMPITLTIKVSRVEPNVPYVLYRYNRLDAVPESEFNAHANQAFEKEIFTIRAGSTYTVTKQIQSDEVAVYRVVKASGP